MSFYAWEDHSIIQYPQSGIISIITNQFIKNFINDSKVLLFKKSTFFQLLSTLQCN